MFFLREEHTKRRFNVAMSLPGLRANTTTSGPLDDYDFGENDRKKPNKVTLPEAKDCIREFHRHNVSSLRVHSIVYVDSEGREWNM